MQAKSNWPKSAMVILLTLIFSFQVEAQNTPLTQAKEGDYVIISAKRFMIRTDNGEKKIWKRMWEYFYVDSVDAKPGGMLRSVHLTNGMDANFSIYFDGVVEGRNNYDRLRLWSDIGVCDSCDPKGFYVKYICNDSLSQWSSHKSRPFLYGFNYSKEKCAQFIPDIKFMELQPGDKVASIGAASGWYEGALSVNTENISYTIEDVDKYLLNEKQFNGVVNHFTSVCEGKQTNTFDYVLGTFDSTGLSRGKYDKIIIRNAYHEFDQKWKMIHDLKSKLNPASGKIILKDESFSSFYYSHFHSGCDFYSNQLKNVMKFFAAQGLYLEKMRYPMNSLENDVIFGLDKKKSDDYLKSLEEINKMMFKVDRLNTSFYASNLDYVQEVEEELKKNLNQVHSTYDSLHIYLSDIGSNWADEDKYEYALNVLTLSNNLYPNIAYTNFYLGISYYGLHEEDMGDVYFEKCIALDATRKEDVEAFKKVWRGMWGEE